MNLPDDDKPKYDLIERTAVFSEDIIEFVMKLRRDEVTRPLISQLVRAGTSIGSNYSEADEAGTKKEFRYRISLCLREAKETKFFLRMMAKAAPEKIDQGRRLWREADELNRIFAAIRRNSDDDDNK